MVKQIVEKNVSGFAWHLVKWLLLALPATSVNSLLRYMEQKLALAFRTRLVDHAYKLYMTEQTYYRVGNLDSRLDNVDQNLTEDILQFSNAVAHLYSALSKPILDVAVVCIAIVKSNMAQQGPSGKRSFWRAFAPLAFGGLIIAGTGAILKATSPPFGTMIAEQAARDGHLRMVHSRVITNAEEIAFYGGHAVEESMLRKAFNAMAEQTELIHRKKLSFVVIEQYLMKYVWNAAGFVMIAAPQLLSTQDISVGDRTRAYTVSSNLLVTASDACERIMSAYKDVIELAGFTERVSSMFDIFNDMHKQRYVKNSVRGTVETGPGSANAKNLGAVDDNDRDCVVIDHADAISIDKVPIITPNGDTLIESLSLQLGPGRHTLISGPNGCGKSSLFRVISGLWPTYAGRLEKVAPGAIFYIPQRPYLPLGNLRAQIIYPDSEEDMTAKGWTDAMLMDVSALTSLVILVISSPHRFFPTRLFY